MAGLSEPFSKGIGRRSGGQGSVGGRCRQQARMPGKPVRRDDSSVALPGGPLGSTMANGSIGRYRRHVPMIRVVWSRTRTWNALLLVDGEARGLAILTSDDARADGALWHGWRSGARTYGGPADTEVTRSHRGAHGQHPRPKMAPKQIAPWGPRETGRRTCRLSSRRSRRRLVRKTRRPAPPGASVGERGS